MPTPFPSHPNYVGYDAYVGKFPSKPDRPKLVEVVEPLKAKDFNEPLPAGWLKRLEQIRQFCAKAGHEFALSPYAYQLAKIRADGFVVVLWSAKRKPGKQRYIKPVFEGAPHRADRAEGLLNDLRSIIEGGA